MLGGILALPRSAQYAQEEVLQKRAMLKDTGMSDAEILKVLPDAPMGWMRAGPGVGGRILGGVGDVGALISTIAGQPIGPPRATMTDLAAASKMRKEFKQQNAYEALAASIEKDDPIGANLIRSGNIDAYGRRSAAQLAHPPGDFGKSELGMRAELEWLRKNQPNSPRIQALEKAIADVEANRPPPPPPPLTPEQRINEKLEADRRLAEQQRARKEQQAKDLGLVPGTDDYKRFMGGTLAAPPRARDTDYYQKALEIVKQQTLPGQEVDMDAVDRLATELRERHERFAHPPKPGEPAKPGAPPPAGGGQLPPGTPPAAPPEQPAGGGALPSPPSQAEQQANARTKVMQLIRPPGGRGTPVAPAVIAQQYPDLWATAGLTGMEGTSPEDLATYLTPSAPSGDYTRARAQVQQLLVPSGGRGTPATPAQIAQQFPDAWAAAGLTGKEGMTSEELRTYLGGGAPTEGAPAPEQQQALPRMTSEKTGKPMSEAGVREFMALQQEVQAGASKERQAQIAVRLHQLE